MYKSIQPQSRLLIIQSGHNSHILIIKLGIPFQGLLYTLLKPADLQILDSGSNRLRSHLRLIPANILLPEEKLSIQICEFDYVHVDDVDVSESHQTAVFQDFAAQTAGPHDQDVHGGTEQRFCGGRGKEERVLESGRME